MFLLKSLEYFDILLIMGILIACTASAVICSDGVCYMFAIVTFSLIFVLQINWLRGMMFSYLCNSVNKYVYICKFDDTFARYCLYLVQVWTTCLCNFYKINDSGK